MNCSEFQLRDYVAVLDPDGKERSHGYVTGESYSGYWVTFPTGTSALIPSERLRLVLRVTVEPRDVVSTPTDKVTAAQEEYDRLKDAQAGIDRRTEELVAEKIAAMRQANDAAAKITECKEQRKANSARMTQLKTFLELAETI